MSVTKQSLALFLKDFKSLWKGILIIYIVQVLQMFLAIKLRDIIPRSDFAHPNPIQMLWLTLGNNLFYLYALYFFVTLTLEKRSRNSFQAGLPEPVTGLSILYKYMILITGILGMVGIWLAYTCLNYNAGKIKVDPRVIMGGFIHMFSGPFIALCLVVTVWGVMNAVHRLRHIAAVAAFISGFLFYRYSELLTTKFTRAFKPPFYQWGITYLLSTLLVGVVFCGIGLLLYNRFADD